MPQSPQNSSLLLVLRLWLEPGQAGKGAWRASLLNPDSHQRRYFSDPAQLSDYLGRLNLRWPDELDWPEAEEHSSKNTASES